MDTDYNRRLARAYAQTGTAVLPMLMELQPNGTWSKRSCYRHHDATTDPDCIAEMWRLHPGAAVGIPCGPVGGGGAGMRHTLGAIGTKLSFWLAVPASSPVVMSAIAVDSP